MAQQYGTVKVDVLTYTSGTTGNETDVSVDVSGLVNNPTFSGDVNISGNLTVDDNVSVSGNLDVSGLATFSGITVTGDSTLSGDVNVSGLGTFSGITVTGDATIGGDLTVSGDINASGVTISGINGLFASGTEAAPSISFVDDTDTGLYSPGANQVAISTNGSQRLLITANGAVVHDYAVATGGLAAYSSASGGLYSYFNSAAGIISAVTDNSGTAGTLIFATGSERMRITSDGSVNIKGAGTAGSTQAVSFNGSAPVNSLVIDSTGKVGLGTSAPTSIFHVAGTSSTPAIFDRTDTTGTFISLKDSASQTFIGNTNGVFSIQTPGSSYSDKLVVTSGGLVGIGTTSPVGKLSVETPSATDPNTVVTAGWDSTYALIGDSDNINGANLGLGFKTGGITSGFGTQIVSLDPNADWYPINYHGNLHVWYGGGTERARIDSSGRLLVGTSTARTNIDYALGTSGSQLQVEQALASTNFSIVQNFDSGTIAAPATLTLARSGATSIGSTAIVASGNRLGEINFSGSDGTNFTVAAFIRGEVDGTPGANDMPGRLVFSTTNVGSASPTEKMRITETGTLTSLLGIYNVTTANAADVNISAAGTLRRSTSSAKYKTDIETLQDSYSDALLQCRPVWYRSTCDEDNASHSYWGFIAEEVAAIDPRLVHWKTVDITYDKNGSVVKTPCDPEPEGVAYDRFVPHLLNLIKRQGEAIAELKSEVAALKGA